MEASGRFSYRITLPNGAQHEITIVLDPDTLLCQAPEALDQPWTARGFHQCRTCPLSTDTVALCPMAAHLAPIVEKIGALLSFEQLDVDITWDHRHLQGRAPAQRIASSIIGLVSATSGCPKSGFLKPMAWFHLPFATEEETIFRAVSSYLLGQYFAAARDETPDWSLAMLKQHYSELHTVNVDIARRLREACKHDAVVNAVILLDLFAKAVPFSVEESLDSLKPLFDAKTA